MVCGGLRWFAVICGGLSFSHTPHSSALPAAGSVRQGQAEPTTSSSQNYKFSKSA